MSPAYSCPAHEYPAHEYPAHECPAHGCPGYGSLAPSSRLPSRRIPLPSLPLKYRRKSQSLSDYDDDQPTPTINPFRHPSDTIADALILDYSSASSSPIATSAALGSSPNSPTDYPRVRYQSSPPRQEYYYAQPSAAIDLTIRKPPLPRCSPPSTRPCNHLRYDLDLEASGYSEDMELDPDEEDDPDPDFFSHQRRISFSTSAERDQPFIRPRIHFPRRPDLSSRTTPPLDTPPTCDIALPQVHPPRPSSISSPSPIAPNDLPPSSPPLSSSPLVESSILPQNTHQRTSSGREPSPTLPPTSPSLSPLKRASLDPSLPPSSPPREPSSSPLPPTQDLPHLDDLWASVPHRKSIPISSLLLSPVDVPLPDLKQEQVVHEVPHSPSSEASCSSTTTFVHESATDENLTVAVSSDSVVPEVLPLAPVTTIKQTPPLPTVHLPPTRTPTPVLTVSSPNLEIKHDESVIMSSPLSPPPSTLEDNIDDSEHVLPVLTVDPKSDMEVDQPVEKKKKRKVEHEDVKEKTKKKMRVVLSESEGEQQRGHERDIDVERVKKRRRKEKEKENDKDAVKSTRTCASEDRESKPKAVAAIQDESAPAPPRRKRGRPPKIRPPPPDPHPSEPEGDPAKNKSSSSSSNCDPSPSTHRHPRHGRASPAPHPPLSPSQLPAILPLPLDEFQGMLIESFATSRASSLPASSLYNSIMDARPALGEVGSCWDHLDERREVVCGVGGEGGEVRQEVEERKGEGEVEKMSQKEWMWLIEGVLEEGRRRCGVFGKVESSFKDDRDRKLQAQWFYVPERDEDVERASLIRSMMPRAGKRSETKKYKQYYWRPLGKISRWDDEDAM